MLRGSRHGDGKGIELVVPHSPRALCIESSATLKIKRDCRVRPDSARGNESEQLQHGLFLRHPLFLLPRLFGRGPFCCRGDIVGFEVPEEPGDVPSQMDFELPFSLAAFP